MEPERGPRNHPNCRHNPNLKTESNKHIPKEPEKACLVAVCQVCTNPLFFYENDAIWIIENEKLQCHVCNQENPITDKLKNAILDIV